MPNRSIPSDSQIVLFIPPFFSFRSCFIQSPCIKSELFPSSWDRCCSSLPLLPFCHQVTGTEATIPGKVQLDPLTWPSELWEMPQSFCQRLCPLLLSICFIPCFLISSSLRFPSPMEYFGIPTRPTSSHHLTGKTRRVPDVMSVFPTPPNWTYKHCPSGALHE